MLKDKIIFSIHSLGDRKSKILSLLHYAGKISTTLALRELATNIGLREALKWNVSDILRKAESAGLVICRPEGWQLTLKGMEYLAGLGIAADVQLVAETKHNLDTHLASIKCSEKRRFLQEAVSCFEYGLHRSAVVLSWVGAVSIMQKHVADGFLNDFNRAGQARFAQKFKARKALKDFAALKESDFLELCQDISVIDKAEKAELQARLDLRNRCGHPNSLIIAEHAAANHLEILLHNVYLRY